MKKLVVSALLCIAATAFGMDKEDISIEKKISKESAKHLPCYKHTHKSINVIHKNGQTRMISFVIFYCHSYFFLII